MAFTTRLCSYTTFSILSQPPRRVAQQLLDVFAADADVFGWSLLEATKGSCGCSSAGHVKWGKECMVCF